MYLCDDGIIHRVSEYVYGMMFRVSQIIRKMYIEGVKLLLCDDGIIHRVSECVYGMMFMVSQSICKMYI